jgi:hypothetical protein
MYLSPREWLHKPAHVERASNIGIIPAFFGHPDEKLGKTTGLLPKVLFFAMRFVQICAKMPVIETSRCVAAGSSVLLRAADGLCKPER